MEFLVVIAFFGYIFYLRNYADLRTPSEKEEAALSNGIALLKRQEVDAAFRYFDQRITEKPKSAVAFLYRGLCYQAMNKSDEALTDIQTAVSLDDNFFDIQFELGKLYFERGMFKDAELAFTKAITLSGGQSAAAFQWRGNCLLELNERDLAEDDFATAKAIAARPADEVAGQKKQPFIDRHFMISSIMVFATSALLVSVITDAESVHLPYLVAVFSALSIGFAEPYRGWMLAILQCLLVFLGYTFFTDPPEGNAQKELHNFSLYGSMILTFAASFLGGFLKRALNMK
jgi:tetratricopeptide (TPR) repeat protein